MYGVLSGHLMFFISSSLYLLCTSQGKSIRCPFSVSRFNWSAISCRNPINIILSLSCGAPNSNEFTNCSVKQYPLSRNCCFSSSKKARCLAVLYNPFTFSNKKKSGKAVHINLAYVSDNLPFSPSRPLFLPATEKSGHGGPPINPVSSSSFDSSTQPKSLCILFSCVPSTYSVISST